MDGVMLQAVFEKINKENWNIERNMQTSFTVRLQCFSKECRDT